MSTLSDFTPIISALGPLAIQSVIQIVQALHPVPAGADQAAKDAVNATKATAAVSAVTALANTLPVVTGASTDPTALTNAIAGAVEVMYQMMKGNGTLTATPPVAPATTLVATKPAPSATAPITSTAVIITGAAITAGTAGTSLTITGNMRTAQ